MLLNRMRGAIQYPSQRQAGRSAARRLNALATMPDCTTGPTLDPTDAPGAEALLMLHGVGHGLGGIAGLDAKETETEVPDVLEATKRLTLAWLRMALRVDQSAWADARAAIEGPASALAHIVVGR
jgi:hypothetical protein